MIGLLLVGLVLASEPEVPADTDVAPAIPSASQPVLTGHEALDPAIDLPASPACPTEPSAILARVRPYLSALASPSRRDSLGGTIHWGAALATSRASLADPSVLPTEPRAYAEGVRRYLAAMPHPYVTPDRLDVVLEHTFVRQQRPDRAWVHVGGIGVRGALILLCLPDEQWWIVEHESAW